MSSETSIYISGAFLLLLWTGLVLTGHADPELINEIKAILVSLGVVHAGLNFQRVPKQTGGSSETPQIPPAKDAP